MLKFPAGESLDERYSTDCCFFLAFAMMLATAVTVRAQVVVVKAGQRLIDGRGGPPLEPAMIRISGERIEEVAASLIAPAGATVMNLGAATLLPRASSTYTHASDKSRGRSLGRRADHHDSAGGGALGGAERACDAGWRA